jgi:hypothetical protein
MMTSLDESILAILAGKPCEACYEDSFHKPAAGAGYLPDGSFVCAACAAADAAEWIRRGSVDVELEDVGMTVSGMAQAMAGTFLPTAVHYAQAAVYVPYIIERAQAMAAAQAEWDDE